MQNRSIGHKLWAIPDGYLPQTESIDVGRNGYISHECLCILNAGSAQARLVIRIYFENRDPITIEDITVSGCRSRHLRLNELMIGRKPAIDQGCPYSILVEADVPVVVQMSRLDTTQSNMAFLSTMAFPIRDQ
jgi:hypothetical protein